MTSAALHHALRAHQSGDLSSAEAGYRAILQQDPQHVDALYLLGDLLQSSGRPADAIEPLRQALAIRPTLHAATAALALSLHTLGRAEDALVLLFTAISEKRANPALRQLLARLLQNVVLHTGNALVTQVLIDLCRDEQIPTQQLASALLGLIKGLPDFADLQQPMRAHSPLDSTRTATMGRLLSDPLLQVALPQLVITDIDVEAVLTAVRHMMLHAHGATEADPLTRTFRTEHVSTLAAQCFNTEYSWAAGADEWAMVATLRATLQTHLMSPSSRATMPGAPIAGAPLECTLAMYALYAPLHTLDGWEALREVPFPSWSATMRPLIKTQIIDWDTERQIADALPSLTAVADRTSVRVQAQYEEHPYPRWLSLQQPEPTTIPAFIRTLRPDVSHAIHDSHILVAGSGTGQQPLHLARSFPNATIVAFDLSRRSLAYAARMAAEHSVSNVVFMQGDLLQLHDAERKWPIISCSGVLHHLRDPLEGWARLVQQLAPNGVMKIGLYSRLARAAVFAARDIAVQHDCRADAEGIRALRQHLVALPAHHVARGVLSSPDFYSVSGCRDLIVHEQECTYTIPELHACLEQLQLRFLGFQLPNSVQVRFRNEFPEAQPQSDLLAWSAFEEQYPETFAGMYQFWCCLTS